MSKRKKNVIPDYNNLPEGKRYGKHDYPEFVKAEVLKRKFTTTKRFCKHGCGCWLLRYSEEGGPVGLDPLNGECPGNPLSGKKLGGNLDWATVVVRRIYYFLSMQKAISVAGFSLKQLLQFAKGERPKEPGE